MQRYTDVQVQINDVWLFLSDPLRPNGQLVHRRARWAGEQGIWLILLLASGSIIWYQSQHSGHPKPPTVVEIRNPVSVSVDSKNAPDNIKSDPKGKLTIHPQQSTSAVPEQSSKRSKKRK
jgi:hypothetical protein